jgi:EAL domain-containing protein (putative c-di-GMP-specific phosphodiesterase class I)/GGDEF domain-containing protein
VSLIEDLSRLDAPGAARRTLGDLAGTVATDPSTGLPTWRGLQARLVSGRSDAGVFGAVLAVDRAVGAAGSPFQEDHVLVRLAEEVRHHLPRGSEVARLGPDELVIVAPGSSAGLLDPLAVVRDAAARVARDATLGLRVEDVSGRLLVPTTAAGLLAQVHRVQRELLSDPGPALAGPIVVEDDMATGDELHRALERSEFRLAFQPVLDRLGGIVSVEAFIRWESPEQGLLLPGSFLPAVERAGLDVEVGGWVLRQALTAAARWADRELDGVPVVVNVSAAQLTAPGLAEQVAASLAESGAPGIVLEIAPRPDEVDLHGLIGAFRELREAGARLSLDRVDSGAVSAGLLGVLPLVDTVKLDRSVVADLHGGGRATTAALRILADRAGVRLGATGVETADQLATLRRLGVDDVQGYRFCPPVPAVELPGRANPLTR